MSFHYNTRQIPKVHTHLTTNHLIDNRVCNFSPQKFYSKSQFPCMTLLVDQETRPDVEALNIYLHLSSFRTAGYGLFLTQKPNSYANPALC